jgi:hypothetical protein
MAKTYEEHLRDGRLKYRTEQAARDYATAMTEEPRSDPIATVNPTCPACGHYNAMLSGVCRDCGFSEEITADTAMAILGKQKFNQGGGWGTLGSREVYVVFGCHRETPTKLSWRVKEVR